MFLSYLGWSIMEDPATPIPLPSHSQSPTQSDLLIVLVFTGDQQTSKVSNLVYLFASELNLLATSL